MTSDCPNPTEAFARLIAEQVAKRLRDDFARTSPWFTPDDAATYLSMTKRGLEDMRAHATGPRFHKVSGRLIRYHRADLDGWLLSDGKLTVATIPENRYLSGRNQAQSGKYQRQNLLATCRDRCAVDCDKPVDIQHVEARPNSLDRHFATNQMLRSARHVDKPVATAIHVQDVDMVAFIPAKRTGQRVARASWHRPSPREVRCGAPPLRLHT